jgi:Predicted integral membrane protein (DUF2269)
VPVMAAAFSDYVLAVHIIAVVVAFGVTFAYPIFALVGGRLDRRAMPWFHRMQATIGRRLTSPGLLLVLIAGVILAADEHQWKYFYVPWGIGVVIVLGALEGAVMVRGEEQLAEIAERDIAASGGRDVVWSEEYEALFKRLGGLGALMDFLVVITIFFMAVRL